MLLFRKGVCAFFMLMNAIFLMEKTSSSDDQQTAMVGTLHSEF
jgi:hypothetical protein